jgi:uncharacterized protein YpuA (DUF1002 family)
MKNKKLISLFTAAAISAALLVPGTTAYADSQEVVTIGADLNEAQKNAILQYFGIYGKNIETITINNQDERNHLASYIPIEQIGTRTYSCALVQPTTSGGIQVKTANLSYVTSNMIATTLSTAGVSNCNVIAASPFEVSGTGALTGVIMAYETATDTTLDSTKKDIANQELVTTGTIAQTVGQNTATQIVNDIKIQVISGQVVDQDQVDAIVDEVVNKIEEEKSTETETTASGETEQQTVTAELSDTDRQMLKDLANKIAQQNYDYDQMKATLDRVEQNVSDNASNTSDSSDSSKAGSETAAPSETNSSPDAAQTETAAAESETQTAEDAARTEEFFSNTDSAALKDVSGGEITNESTTFDTEASTDTAGASESTEAASTESSSPFDITTSDSYGSDTAQTEASDASDETAAVETGAENAASETSQTTGAENAAADTTEAAAATEQSEGAAALTLGEVKTIADLQSDIFSDYFRIYAANANLKFTSGTLDVTGPDGTVASIDLTDISKCQSIPLSQDKLTEFNWTEGTEFVVSLKDALEGDGNYSFTLSSDASVASSADGADVQTAPTAVVAINPASLNIHTTEGLDIDSSTLRDFDVTNGTSVSVPCTALDFVNAEASTDSAGETASEAATAQITIADSSIVTADTASLDYAAGVTGFSLTPVSRGETTVTITYYDANGAQLNSYPYTITVF